MRRAETGWLCALVVLCASGSYGVMRVALTSALSSASSVLAKSYTSTVTRPVYVLPLLLEVTVS